MALGAELSADPEEAVRFVELMRRVKPRDEMTIFGRWLDAVGRWALRAGEVRIENSGFREDVEQLDEAFSNQVRETTDRMESIES